MTPDALRSASHVLFVMGIAAAVGLALQDHVWHLAGWALALAWLLAGFALDLVSSRAERAHEREVERVRRTQR